MRKSYLLSILFSISCFVCFSQEIKINEISFSNESLISAIQKLEQQNDVYFFYNQDWLNDINVEERTFTNKNLDFILTELLKETQINFTVLNQKVILTKNNFIYTDLPKSFISASSTKDTIKELENNEVSPIFYENISNSNDNDKEKNQKITFIGKQKKGKLQTTFILTGKIIDKKTGQALPYVNVTAQNNKITTISDETGKYQLNLPTGLNTIKVSSIGYFPQQRKILMYSDGYLDFNLNESINELDAIVINSENKANVRTAVTGVTRIDAEEIKNIPMVLGERDVLKVALVMPGVKTAGEGSSGFNVRGGKTDQNLILLDGGLIYNPFHFFGFFSAVNAYTISSANIYKGSIPAQYGGRLSSVFDIQTKNPDTTKFSGEAGLGPVTSKVKLNIPIVKNKSSLMVGGRATYSDWILRNLDSEDLKDSQASFYDLLAKYKHQINDNNNIESTIYYSKDQFSLTSDSLYNYSNRMMNVKWSHLFNDKHNGNILLTNSQYLFDIDYEDDLEPDSFNFGYEVNETMLKSVFNYEISKKHKLTYGVSTKLYQTSPGNFTPTNSESLLESQSLQEEQGLESAIYLSDAFDINDKLLINAGLRYSTFSTFGAATQRRYATNAPKSDDTAIETIQYSDNELINTYDGIEARISGRYFLDDNLSVKASFDMNNQYVHLLSTNTTQSPTDTWKLSDLNIKPQSSNQYSLGIFKNFTYKKNNYEVSLEGYYKTLDNMLDYKVGAELILNEYLETEVLQGKGKAYGAELLIKKNNGKLNGWLGYTYSRSFLKLDGRFEEETINNGEYFPSNFDKPHDFSLVLNYKITNRYSVSSNFIYQTGRPITYPVGNYQYNNAEYVLYSDRNQFRIPDYYRLDIGFNIEGNHKIKKIAHSFWNISIYNVLGRNNPYSIFFVTDNGEVEGYKTSIFSIPVPTVTYNFKF